MKEEAALRDRQKRTELLQKQKLNQEKLKHDMTVDKAQQLQEIRKKLEQDLFIRKQAQIAAEKQRAQTVHAERQDQINKALQAALEKHKNNLAQKEAKKKQINALAEKAFKEAEDREIAEKQAQIDSMKKEWEAQQKKEQLATEQAKQLAESVRQQEEERHAKEIAIKQEKHRLKKIKHEEDLAKLRAEVHKSKASSKAEKELHQKEIDEISKKLLQTKLEKQRLHEIQRDLKEKNRILNEKLIANQKQAKDIAHSLKKKQEALKHSQALAEEAKKRFHQTQLENQEANNQLMLELEKQRQEVEKKAEEQKAEAEKAHEAAKMKHEQEIAAMEQAKQMMKAKEEAELKAQVARIRAQNEKLMENIWGYSSTGLSIASVTVPNQAEADKLIEALFKKTLIADVQDFSKVQKVHKPTLIGNHVQNTNWDDIHRLTMVTSDQRVAQLIEEVVDVTGNQNSDIMIRQLSGVSQEYAKWVSWQTQIESPKFILDHTGVFNTYPTQDKDKPHPNLEFNTTHKAN